MVVTPPFPGIFGVNSLKNEFVWVEFYLSRRERVQKKENPFFTHETDELFLYCSFVKLDLLQLNIVIKI